MQRKDADYQYRDNDYEDIVTKRERVWLLIKFITDPNNPNVQKKDAAQVFYMDWRENGNEDYVVVRVDIVEDDDFDMVIPVDARQGKLHFVETGIEENPNMKLVKTLLVSQHYPKLSYMAHGFVSYEEYEKAKKEHVHPDLHGRIKRRSPGDNPWG